jgi:hypothetical protein
MNKEDMKTLLYHYRNLQVDTPLLVQLCGQRNVSLAEGFDWVCDRIQELEEGLAK